MAAEAQNRVQIAASHWKPRFVANGIDVNDFERVVSSTTEWKEWGPAWLRTGDLHRQLGDEAAECTGRRGPGYKKPGAPWPAHGPRRTWCTWS